jgi:tetratricopeptide (TPR) repeat protein
MAFVYPVDARSYKLKAITVYLAGPLLNLFLGLLFLAVDPQIFGTPDAEAHPIGCFAVANLLASVGSLYPRKIEYGGMFIETDGLQAYRTFIACGERRQANLVSGMLMRAASLRNVNRKKALETISEGLREFPDDMHLLSGKAVAEMDLGNYAAAREILQSVASRAAASFEKATIYNNMAWNNVLMADESLLDEADEYSRKAIELYPSVPAFQGTRGSVLVWKGELKAGLEMLKSSLALQEKTRSDLACNGTMIALAELKLGNIAESKRWKDFAIEQDPECPLLKRLRAPDGDLTPAQSGLKQT